MQPKEKIMYIGMFDKKEDVFDEFDCSAGERYSSEILFAAYDEGDYCGSAFVLIHIDGKLYEVNGDHFSCYGLEGQWDPEETSIKVLKHRLKEGRLGGFYEGSWKKDFAKVLKKLENEIL
jgi:hypothetical protein